MEVEEPTPVVEEEGMGLSSLQEGVKEKESWRYSTKAREDIISSDIPEEAFPATINR